MLRKILAVLGGIIVGISVIFLCHFIINKIYPAPSLADFDNAHVLSRIVSQMPRGTYFLLLIAYAIGSFTGGLAATFLGNRKEIVFSVATGVLVMVGTMLIINMFQIATPLWFMISSLLICIPFSVLGYLVVMDRK
jgi:hypothetical protein